MKIISGILILITAFLSFRHGWLGLTMSPEQLANITNEFGVSKSILYVFSGLTLGVGFLVLFPVTYFAANTVNALLFILIMAFQLKSGNYVAALIEIPFLFMPLLMIYLGHPLKNQI